MFNAPIKAAISIQQQIWKQIKTFHQEINDRTYNPLRMNRHFYKSRFANLNNPLKINQKMEEECFICRKPFNRWSRHPMLLCPSQHISCKICAKLLFRKLNSQKCPICRSPIQEINVKKLRLYEKLLKLKDMQQENRKIHRFSKKLFKSTLKSNLYAHQTTEIKDMITKTSIQTQHYGQLAQFLQVIIEKQSENDKEIFIGLGSKEEETGFSQEKGYKWYQKRYKVSQLSLYDQLALCNMLTPDYEPQKKWYQKMIKKDSKNYKAMYGLALTQHNNKYSTAALQLYEQITKIQPDFSKTYEMIGFIHLPTLQRVKAAEAADKCLALQPGNIFAELIKTKSSNVQERVKRLDKLQDIMKKQPQYTRMLHCIADIKYANQNFDQAIDICKQCIQINKNWIIVPSLSIASYLFEGKRCSEIIDFIKDLDEDAMTEHQFLTYYSDLAQGYSQQGKKAKAAEFLKEYLEYRQGEDGIVLFLADIHYDMGKYEQALCQYQSVVEQQEGFHCEDHLKISRCLIALKRYNQAIHILKKVQEIQEFEEIKQVYQNLVIACIHAKQHSQALQYIQKCNQKKLNIDKKNYSPIVNGLINGGKLNECLEVIKIFKQTVQTGSPQCAQLQSSENNIIRCILFAKK